MGKRRELPFYQMGISPWKECQLWLLLGKFKLKPQHNTSSRMAEILKNESDTIKGWWEGEGVGCSHSSGGRRSNDSAFLFSASLPTPPMTTADLAGHVHTSSSRYGGMRSSFRESGGSQTCQPVLSDFEAGVSSVLTMHRRARVQSPEPMCKSWA